MKSISVLAALLFAVPAHAIVDVAWVVVRDPGNAPDPAMAGSSFGGVAAKYRIGQFEVTNGQYAEFLNAVAATDTNALYNTMMADSITRTGSSGNFSYLAVPGRQNIPVGFVSFYDSLSFANWLHNGQPTGDQDDTTTEDGAYTLTASGIADNTITRNPGAEIFLPSEDEWYKAAYYDTDTMTYYDFPTSSNITTRCRTPGAMPNSANCLLGFLTNIGAYTRSASPNGTFDQGGNVSEWNETIIDTSLRGIRGGSTSSPFLIASLRQEVEGGPSAEIFDLGFRVATPEPPPSSLHLIAFLTLLALRIRHPQPTHP